MNLATRYYRVSIATLGLGVGALTSGVFGMNVSLRVQARMTEKRRVMMDR